MHIVKINLSNLKRKKQWYGIVYFQIDACIVNTSLSLKYFLISFFFFKILFFSPTTAVLILLFIAPQEYLI